VDETKGGELLKRITAIRRQVALEQGFVVPAVHIRDNMKLKANDYVVLIKGMEVARGELLPGYCLAMQPGESAHRISGIPTKEPCFGLDALWVPEADKERAQAAGYTVVDLSSVIATHLTEVIKSHAHELVGRQEAQALLERFSKEAPKLVEELVPALLPLGAVVKVLGNLLRERIPIRDLRSILEALADCAVATKDPETLTEAARQALSRTITRQFQTRDGSLPVIALDPQLDHDIASAIKPSNQGPVLALDPTLGQKIVMRVRQAVERLMVKGYQPVVLCSPMVRPHVRRLLERALPAVGVISSNEVAPQIRIQAFETVRVADAH
jgi:flagellar biosynthesis protein FlhA